MKVTTNTKNNDATNHASTSLGMTSNIKNISPVYGAFELKHIYPKNYSVGLGVAIVFHLLLVLIYVLVTPKEKIDASVKQYKIITYVDLGPPPSIVRDDYFNTPPQPKPTFGKITIAKKGEETTDLEIPKQSSEPASNIKVESPKPVVNKEILVDETYYVAVDMMPEPFGGMEAMQKNVTYPDQARKESIVGKVFVKAFINENGEVTRAEIVKGLGSGCDEEALWIVKSTRFRPGKKNGNRVKVQFTLSLSFRPN